MDWIGLCLHERTYTTFVVIGLRSEEIVVRNSINEFKLEIHGVLSSSEMMSGRRGVDESKNCKTKFYHVKILYNKFKYYNEIKK